MLICQITLLNSVANFYSETTKLLVGTTNNKFQKKPQDEVYLTKPDLCS